MRRLAWIYVATCPNSYHVIQEPLCPIKISFQSYVSRLRDQLGTAKNANEMFRIFSRFNALFVRPHIRGAIREYQTQLIQRVKVTVVIYVETVASV